MSEKYYDKIMSIRVGSGMPAPARDAAAEIANEADREIEELKAAQRQGGEAVAYCFVDVNGNPSELCHPPECASPEDARTIMPLYTAPKPAVPEGYAGVKMWIGDKEVTKIVPEHVVNYELESGSAITFAAQSCLNQLAERPEPPEET